MCKKIKEKKDKDSFDILINSIILLLIIFVLLPIIFTVFKYFFNIDLDSYLVFNNLLFLLNFYFDNILKIIWPLLIISVTFMFRNELKYLVKKGVFLSFKDVKVEIGTMNTSEVKEALNKVTEELEITNDIEESKSIKKAPKNSSIIGGVILAYSELEKNLINLIKENSQIDYHNNNIFTENKKKVSKSMIIDYYFKNMYFKDENVNQIYRQFNELRTIRNTLAHITDATDIPNITYAEYKLSCDAVLRLMVKQTFSES